MRYVLIQHWVHQSKPHLAQVAQLNRFGRAQLKVCPLLFPKHHRPANQMTKVDRQHLHQLQNVVVPFQIRLTYVPSPTSLLHRQCYYGYQIIHFDDLAHVLASSFLYHFGQIQANNPQSVGRSSAHLD